MKPGRAGGKLPATFDGRVPHFSLVHAAGLPDPKPSSNWYAKVHSVPMLGNDRYGCCVFATIFHWVQQIVAYANPDDPVIEPTTDECLAAYSQVTGFQRDDPATDNGTVMMGPGGALEFWTREGLIIAGRKNTAGPAVSLDVKNPRQLRQAIGLYGGVLMGAQMPESWVDADYEWGEPSGNPMGGHEFLIDGYDSLPSGVYYHVRTWDGDRVMKEAGMLACADEAIAVFNLAALDARGIDGAGMNRDVLLAGISALKAG